MSGQLPLYARVLRLRHLHPGGLLCFLFFEGAVALGILLALADLAPWWSALVLPAAVAVMVKVNDVVAGGNARIRLAPAHARAGAVRGLPPARRAAVPKARPAQTPPPASRTAVRNADADPARVRGRATAPGALPPSDLPGFGSGAGSLGVVPPSTGTVYRHTGGDVEIAHHQVDDEVSAEHRRGLNQGRFGQPG